MDFRDVNYLAVLTSGLVIFLLGGLWYSPVLFAGRWMRLMGKSEAELRAGSTGAMPVLYLLAFLCALLSAWVLAIIINRFGDLAPLQGAVVGALCWLGFAGATSYANALFSMKPRQLWLIDSGYNLVSLMLAGAILAAWR